MFGNTLRWYDKENVIDKDIKKTNCFFPGIVTSDERVAE